ncbi:unnamed protein product [Parascedosporium putredinis]|uniref:Uncharacterized protein n=1 Tax=Parascedosporium putredinis TaxID=1442378 RepID=A0A9P1MB99_9PEZI|nr:unnamed protein product [Parascedosporium putredinis]CAI7995838.1 unnamed protein product [Parascedosporium putredinis]
MVAKPPAKYETRLKLLKLVHTEISRLNDGLAKSERENKTRPSGNANPHDQGPGARPEKEAGKKDASIALPPQDLIVLALGEEETAALDKPDIYTTAMRNVYMKYKRMTPDQWWDVCKAKQSAEKSAWAPADGGKQIVTGHLLAVGGSAARCVGETQGEVLDLNSRYSGVFPEDMVNAEPYGAYDTENLPVPTEIKAASAEGPAKRQYKILEDASSIRGHDSAEDARAAGALARLKVKDEWDRLKLEGWSVVRGNIVSPD